MNKLKLELDTLSVQSFTTDAGSRDKGTVQGNLLSDYCNSIDICVRTEGPGCGGWDPGTGSCSGVIGTCVTCAGAGCGGGGQTSRCV